METPRTAPPPIWQRILQFPLTRLVVLGVIVSFSMTANNGFLERFKSTPALSIAFTIGMALFASPSMSPGACSSSGAK